MILHLQILGNRFFGAILYNALQSVCFQTTSDKKYDCDIPSFIKAEYR